MITEIGSTDAILASIKTRVDGSVLVSFELNPENSQVINKLMNAYLADNKLFTLGILQGEIINEVTNG